MKDFVPHKESLQLAELGFDEPCLGYYTSTGYFNNKKELKWRKWQFSYNFQPISNKQLTWKDNETENVQQVVSPLYQQAFRWFRKKYGYWSYVKESIKGKAIFYIEKFDEKFYNSEIYNYYEEAELECLRKLIEIVKNDSNTASERKN